MVVIIPIRNLSILQFYDTTVVKWYVSWWYLNLVVSDSYLDHIVVSLVSWYKNDTIGSHINARNEGHDGVASSRLIVVLLSQGYL
jgi:hypothetical protein